MNKGQTGIIKTFDQVHKELKESHPFEKNLNFPKVHSEYTEAMGRQVYDLKKENVDFMRYIRILSIINFVTLVSILIVWVLK